MANYATLKAAIAAAIKENGNKEITGNLLQQQLLAMVNSLGVGYQYAGIAIPDTNPGTPDQNVFYLASTAGTYANFGGLVLADGEIAILKYNGAWSKDSTGAASLAIVNQLGRNVGQFQMPFVSGYYNMAEVGAAMSFDILENTNFVCAKIPCTPGDIFFASGINNVTNPQTPYLYTDANGVVLKRYFGATVTNGYSEAPADAAFFVFVSLKTNAALYCYKKDSAIAIAIRSTFEHGYYECTTAASTALKVITWPGWQTTPTFNSGSNIRVKFSNANSAGSNVTLLGRPIYYNGAPVTNLNTWNAGDVLELFTDGTIWYAKDAAGNSISEINTSVENIEKTTTFKIVTDAADDGIRTLGDVEQTISTDISAAAGYKSLMLNCIPGDLFVVDLSISMPLYTWAIIDKNNKVLRRGKKKTTYGRMNEKCIILVPSNGNKIIFNYYGEYDFTLLKADSGTVESMSAQARENYGYSHIFDARTSGFNTDKGIAGGYGESGIYITNSRATLIPKNVSTGVALQIQFINENNQFANISMGTLTTGVPVEIGPGYFGTPIGLSLSFVPVDGVNEQICDVEIFANTSYYAQTISQKLNKIPSGINTHIPIIGPDGELMDSGYSIDNLPESGLPSGGHDGDVLRTDGINPYWGSIPTQIVTDESQVYGVLVDQYEDLNVGLSSVNSIRRAVEVAGVGGTIVFTPNKTYLIDDTINLLDNQVIIGNGAILKRMDESTTTVAVAIENSSVNTVELASVPTDWKVGNRLFFYDETQGQLGNYIAYADIALISGNDVTVVNKSANPWSLPVGTKVTKSVPMLVGEQAPTPVGFKVYNLKFDGNKQNNSGLLNWYIHGTIMSFGYNTVIRDCQFYNIPTENISTQGAMIMNNFAQNLNGSFVHLSCPSENMLNGNERYMGTFVIGNLCKNVCSVDNDILKHSEAPVTYSWNAGKLIVIGNQFYGQNNSMCFQANKNIPTEPESATEVDSNSYMIYTGNIFANFKKIGEWGGGTAYIYPNQNKRMFTSNMFKDCGTNDMRSLYTKTNIMFELNKFEGNTVVNTDGNTPMYRIDDEINVAPSSAQLTTKFANLGIGGQVYITQLQKQYRKILVNNAIIWIEEPTQIVN